MPTNADAHSSTVTPIAASDQSRSVDVDGAGGAVGELVTAPR
jgi:hypothetical protein